MIDKSSPEWPEKCKAFLEELTELSRKHGIMLWSCGCFDSIGLEPMPDSPGTYRHGCLGIDCGVSWEGDR